MQDNTPTLNLNKYNGAGKKVYDENDSNKIVAIVMTEKQEREHDRSYRQHLIAQGKLVPRK